MSTSAKCSQHPLGQGVQGGGERWATYPAQGEGSLLADSAAHTELPRLDGPAHALTVHIEAAVRPGP